MAERIAKLVLASGNRGKLEDFRALLSGSAIECLLPEDLGLRFEVEESGSSFAQNALLKARACAGLLGDHRLPVLADDSGLEVDALGGRPGIHSARFAGDAATDADNNAKLLRELADSSDRSASFVCVLALLLPGGGELLLEGRCRGRILHQPKGQGGFGYDPLFFQEDIACSFGEATHALKNANSHRAAAVAELLRELYLRGLL